MRYRFAALLLAVMFSLPVLAGEVSTPGIVNPTPTPTPCEDCPIAGSATVSADTDTAEIDPVTLIWMLSGLVWP
jgi:hypothetical protein